MINIQPIMYVTGLLLAALATSMLIPAAVDWLYRDINAYSFVASAAITAFCGLMLMFANRTRDPSSISLRETFLLTSFTWLSSCGFASLPFWLTGSTATFVDSLFEGVSALTTTGTTLIHGLDFASPGIVMWRALLQWMGGVGIIVMALTVLPFLRIGGMQLFRSEFSDRSEKILPRASQVAGAIVLVYVGLTLACFIALYGVGMPPLDALCHAFSTLSTGGLSTSDQSLAHFQSASAEWIVLLFMIIGGSPLILYARLFQGEAKPLLRDPQTRTYLVILVVCALALSLWLWRHDYPFHQALRHGFFHVVGTVTTTGFVVDNYENWGSFAQMLTLVLLMMGACTGSTSGGVKILRYQIMFAAVRAQIHQLRRPHGVFHPSYNGKPIPQDVFISVFTFFGLFIVSLALLSLALSMWGLDLMTCFSGALAVLTNTGIGLGALIGPDGTASALPQGAKWLMMGGMLLGRLEFVTFFILLSRNFWKD
ncbi:MAG: TrkH family potassium uptake protein [Holosporales bacterium]